MLTSDYARNAKYASKDNSMSKNLSSLFAFSVALSAASVCAQSTRSPFSPGNNGPDNSTSGCSTADGEMAGCQNSATQGQGQFYDLGPLSSPGTSLGNPNNISSSVYRDDADGLNRSNESRQHPLIPSKPQSLTEFQILVAGSVGRIVPVYGAELFANVPDTFAPVQRIPVTPEYVVGPGDELQIRLWGQVSQNLQLTVDRSGSIYIPQAGAVRVAGLQFGQLQGFLKSRLDRIYRNYDLNVNLGQLRSIQIFVTGQARRPGSYTIRGITCAMRAVLIDTQIVAKYSSFVPMAR